MKGPKPSYKFPRYVSAEISKIKKFYGKWNFLLFSWNCYYVVFYLCRILQCEETYCVQKLMWTKSFMGSIQECFHVALPGNPPAVRRGETSWRQVGPVEKKLPGLTSRWTPWTDAATVGDGRPTESWSSTTLKLKNIGKTLLKLFTPVFNLATLGKPYLNDVKVTPVDFPRLNYHLKMTV